MNLIQSPLHTPLRIVDIAPNGDSDMISRRLMELGFIQGAVIEIKQQAPILHDPLAILVRGMVVALRRYEAERVAVEVVQ
jgi:Fe2+ transport system protein FeoA